MLLHIAKDERGIGERPFCTGDVCGGCSVLARTRSMLARVSEPMLRAPRRSGRDLLAHWEADLWKSRTTRTAFPSLLLVASAWRILLSACSDGLAIRRFGGPRAKVRR